MNRKKVLIITYYWPPAGGIGVHRCLKFAKYLRKFGWEPVVFTAKNPQYPVLDPTNEKHIPEGIEVHRIPIFEPFSLFRKITGRKPEESANPVYVRDKKKSLLDEISIWIRGNFFIPDARACWIRPAVRYISGYLKKHGDIKAVFSDGPPHTNTRIAWHISKRFGIPWLADFQDPWTQVDYYKLLKITRISDHIHRSMERGVFKNASRITIASPSWARDLESIGANDVRVLYYGYDEEDFQEESISENDLQNFGIPPGKFMITHAGLLGMDRFPETFLNVLAEVCESDPVFRDDLVLFLPGEVDYSIKNYIEAIGLDQNTLYPGHIAKELAVKSMRISSILLLPLNQAENAKGRLPGKLYEYMRSYTPILALGPSGSDVEKILTDSATGSLFNYDDKSGIKDFLSRKYVHFKDDKKILSVIKENVSEYSVENQTRTLADLLNELAHE